MVELFDILEKKARRKKRNRKRNEDSEKENENKQINDIELEKKNEWFPLLKKRKKEKTSIKMLQQNNGLI